MLESVFYMLVFIIGKQTHSVYMNVEQWISCSVVHKNSNNKLLGIQPQVIQIYKSSFLVQNVIHPVLTF